MLKEYIQKCYSEGKKIEDYFIDLIYPASVIKSRSEEDIKDAWDCHVFTCDQYPLLNEKYIDVKGIKSKDDAYNFIELIGYDGDHNQKLGWLFRGNADLIAFEKKDYFYLVDKHTLRNFIFLKIPIIKEVYDIATNKYLNTSKTNRTFNDFLLFEFQQMRDEEKTPVMWKKEDKEKALNEILYSRMRSSSSPDLMIRLLTKELEELAILIVNKI